MRIFLYICALSMTLSCQKDKDVHWSDANIDNNISKSFGILQMDKEELPFLSNQINVKRTSNLLEYAEKALDDNGINCEYSYSQYECKAQLHNSEFVTIDIGQHSYFGGRGYNVEYCKNAFRVEPYSYSDISAGTEEKSVLKIIHQELLLDKLQYVVGDSLFGKINFQIIETKDSEKNQYCLKGYFRTVVISANM
ncbi:hypothetical protein [Dyadobacter sp. CY312]|uniref:hypothetical protein n=1 Tax=Dyadobacter sp. CY312 TaxID=2907303 RepID=UPI001F2F5604|nr:hypothetical protein [Dyadobacter sp. CY312]MCE7040896.1 hypothetical protein [Dyadobacter sp. CY312]